MVSRACLAPALPALMFQQADLFRGYRPPAQTFDLPRPKGRGRLSGCMSPFLDLARARIDCNYFYSLLMLYPQNMGPWPKLVDAISHGPKLVTSKDWSIGAGTKTAGGHLFIGCAATL